VRYLPFAYAPGLHFCERPDNSEEAARFCADVVFAGGADADRVPLVNRLIRERFDVALYGGYWNRFPATRPCARGRAAPSTLRKAIGGSKVALCLVRRANRDGNAMRTFEVAAMGACMLAEYTEEHREILGEDGDAVVYFRTPDEMVDRLRWLVSHDYERRRLGAAVHTRITSRPNTYRDRLKTMMDAVASAARS
jgi:spore maturation protein CgeB